MSVNKTSHGKYIITPETFDRKRIVVDSKPSYSDGNGQSYPIKYRYVTQDGKEKLDYIHTVLPTLSVVYGCSQRESEGAEIKADAKWGLVLGFRVVQDGNLRKGRAVEDDNGNFIKWDEPPRVFKMQEHATGNAFRGDDKTLTPEHSRLILDYYKMLAEVDAEIREQLAVILNAEGKSLTYAEDKLLIRNSSKTPYQDIRATVAQFKDKKDQTKTNVSIRITTDLEGKSTLTFEEFCARSGGARGNAWITLPSTHLSTGKVPRTRCTVDRFLVKSLGQDPETSRENLAVSRDELPDDEGFSEAPPAKRMKQTEEEEEEDLSVFA